MDERDRRNLDAVRRFYLAEQEVAAPDIVWHVPGHNPVSGKYTGWNEYFTLMPSRMVPLTEWAVEFRDLMVNGDFVAATFRLRGERKEKKIDLEGVHLFRINAQVRVAEGWGFTNNQEALDDVFSA